MDKLTEITTRKVDGKLAPDFDTFIWGWGGDPYDPSALLQLSPRTRSAARRTRSTRTPSTTSCSTQQSGEFDPAKRKALIRQMIAITQRDLPYLVLTDDPYLRPIAPTGSRRQAGCPKAGRRRLCQQVSYEPMLTMAPAAAATAAAAAAAGIFIAIGVVLLAGIAFVVLPRGGAAAAASRWSSRDVRRRS